MEDTGHHINFLPGRVPGVLMVIIMCLASCRDPYMPPAITQPNHYLVVDGSVDMDADSSLVRLSRTANLSDTQPHLPETGARLELDDEKGNLVRAFDEKAPGTYTLPRVILTPGGAYKLVIRTADGESFSSDPVTAKTTPPIDSIFWRKDGDVKIYLATHDLTKKTRYYRWTFREDWEYDSYFNSLVGYDINNRALYDKTPDQMTTQCYRSNTSTDILTANTANQVEDRLDSMLLMVIPANTERLTTRYSIEVTQYGLSEASYAYWQELKKNANQLGSIFDPMPSQVSGNMHDLTHPERPVLGSFSVTSPSRMRIFIRNQEVAPWSLPGQSKTCSTPIITTEDSAAYFLYDPKWQPAYYITNLSGGPRGLAVAPQECVDCRTRGGVTTKPAFW